jgi:biopolymer transport protein ExbD
MIRRHVRERITTGYRPFESSSIADLAFLLLIFFIVTGSFVLRQGIFFSLPSRSAGSIRLEEKQILHVQPEMSGFRFNGDVLNRDAFERVLRDRYQASPGSVLLIHMGSSVTYDRFIDTLSVAKEAGIGRVSLKNVEEASYD